MTLKRGRPRMLDCLHLIDPEVEKATALDLRQWRLDLGLSQAALADTLGVSQCTVSRAEAHGKRETWYARMVWLIWHARKQQQQILGLKLALGESVSARGPRYINDPV